MTGEQTIDVGALEIPNAAAVLPAGWWKEHVLPAVAEMQDVDDLTEDRRRLAALARYVQNREQRFEVNAGRIVAEMRIGELLGEPEKGGRGNLRSAAKVSADDCLRFRKLAAHREIVLRMLEQRIASRERILWKIDQPKRTTPATGTELREGDFRASLEDLTDQVDVIVTDPPYPREFLGLYSDLGEVAGRVLRPGGLLVAMVGHVWLPEVLQRLGEHLSYRWIMAYLVGGAAATVHRRGAHVHWKPIVVFERLPSDPNRRIGGDVIRSEGNGRDNSEHHWGQTESGMVALLERLTSPDDLILDPMAGGATTLVAAAALQRRCIGVEIDPAAAARARERLGMA